MFDVESRHLAGVEKLARLHREAAVERLRPRSTLAVLLANHLRRLAVRLDPDGTGFTLSAVPFALTHRPQQERTLP